MHSLKYENKKDSFFTKEEHDLAEAAIGAWDEYQKASVAEMQGRSRVPDAPFKTAWPELALKRMIRLAAEEGKTRISWTPGEAQAARYDLSKQVKTLAYTKDPKTGNYSVVAETHQGGNQKLGDGITPDKLADYVGKEVADKIVNPKFEIKPYDGPQLKGFTFERNGEKMNATYDTRPQAERALKEIYGENPQVEVEIVPEDRPDYLKRLSPKAVRHGASEPKFEIIGPDGKRKSLAETKEQAEKQVELFKNYGQLSGLDLKVGGEFHKWLYDKNLPKLVEKLGKAHGVKVRKGGVGSFRDLSIEQDGGKFIVKEKGDSGNYGVFDSRAKAQEKIDSMNKDGHPVWYFDIPPAWRDQALSKGFPLFMSGVPFPLVAVDYDPFANKEDK